MTLGACGGGGHHNASPAPVAEQVRQALLDALTHPALPALNTARRPQLPYVGVSVCVGPAHGGAGRYRCTTTPRGRRGLRSITVRVKPDGSWSTEAVKVRGQRSAGVTSIWGVGIRLPG
jgi:hypothetical protein